MGLQIVQERLPELLSQFDVDSVGVEEIDQELKQSLEAARQSQTSRFGG